jgi:integrase/recombinase XerD
LAALHALARFVGEHSPEHIAWCGQIRSIPFKKTSKAIVPYVDKPEMDALLGAPDRQTAQGRRDHALLLFLYNSGARAQEAAQVPSAN